MHHYEMARHTFDYDYATFNDMAFKGDSKKLILFIYQKVRKKTHAVHSFVFENNNFYV